MLQHTAAHCNTPVLQMPLAATHCNTLQHTATHCNTLQHTATHLCFRCRWLQHTATHCNTLQHIATHCNTLQHTCASDAVGVYVATHTPPIVLQCVAVCCSVLQCVAVCCSVLQYVRMKSILERCLQPLHQRGACVAGVLRCTAVCCSHSTSALPPYCSSGKGWLGRLLTMGRLLKIIGLFCKRDL